MLRWHNKRRRYHGHVLALPDTCRRPLNNYRTADRELRQAQAKKAKLAVP